MTFNVRLVITEDIGPSEGPTVIPPEINHLNLDLPHTSSVINFLYGLAEFYDGESCAYLTEVDNASRNGDIEDVLRQATLAKEADDLHRLLDKVANGLNGDS